MTAEGPKTAVFLVGIRTERFDDAVVFYRDTLGFGVVQRGEEFCFLSAGSILVTIVPASSDPIFGLSGHWLTVRVDDIEAMRARLAEQGVEVLREDPHNPNGHLLYVADPDGNPIELQSVRED